MPGLFAKDYSLQSCLLTLANNNQIELKHILQEINTYESLYSNHVTAQLLIRDTFNMLGTANVLAGPIFGYETVLLSFQTPDLTLWTKTMRVIRIEGRILEKDRSQVYHLHLATTELLVAMQTRISKSYNGKLISDIATDILENFIEVADPNVEATSVLHQIIIPNLTADHALNWLCTRAISAAYTGASYIYYEDRDGYNFCTIESLIANALPIDQMTDDMKYLYQPGNVRENNPDHHRDVAEDMREVHKYTFALNFNILDNVHAGMYGSTVITHDNVLKQWVRTLWDYPSTFANYQHLTANPLWSAQAGDLNDPGAKFKLHGMGVYEYPVNPPDWIQPRISQMQQMHNIEISVVIPGNTDRTVGDVIAFILPSPEPPINSAQILDNFYYGRYMITAVRHKVDQSSHETILDLVSDSVWMPFP
jgi:hypothetical protein